MKFVVPAALLIAVAAAQTSRPGWSLTFRDRSGHASVVSGSSGRSCTTFLHARGQRIEWDRILPMNGCCVQLWASPHPAPLSPAMTGQRVSGIDFHSFSVRC